MVLVAFLLVGHSVLFSQDTNGAINEKNVLETISILASDSLGGRGNGTADILKAGVYIGNRFKEAGLKPLTGQIGFFVPFTLPGNKGTSAPDILEWNGELVSPGKFMFLHTMPGNYSPKNISDFKIVKLDTCFDENVLSDLVKSDSNVLVWTNKLQLDEENYFPEIINMPEGGLSKNILLVYADNKPASITLTGESFYYNSKGYNVVGMLPGKSKPNEVVIFSAHYDHMGINTKNPKDLIMNGANDDASGTTAVIALADYFAKLDNNERTILFCAFAGEELGLVGSYDFINYLIPESVVAMINIEMIAIPQFGKNKIMITGERNSDLPEILKSGMSKSNFSFRRDNDERKALFTRSDNYPFAIQQVPAHTIMGSDDDDPCYHKPCDEVKRIDANYMTRVIKAIATSVSDILNGKLTPKRIKHIY